MQVLRKYGLLSEDEVDAMEALGESVGLARLSAAQEEDLLGDVPDEFLDPLLGTVMQVRQVFRAIETSIILRHVAGICVTALLVVRRWAYLQMRMQSSWSEQYSMCHDQDPVMLPGSKMTVERSTIERHLLSAKTDPFNRSPLMVDMLQPAAELKGQIEAWKAAQRRQRRNKPMDEG
jgi:ubiquitin conjugation factor E4 B